MDKVAVLIIPKLICPECLSELECLTIDHLRVKYNHYLYKGCSQSNTEIIRPLAQFTVFI